VTDFECGAVANEGLGDHHLADHVHQLVELGGVDADGGGVGGAALLQWRVGRRGLLLERWETRLLPGPTLRGASPRRGLADAFQQRCVDFRSAERRFPCEFLPDACEFPAHHVGALQHHIHDRRRHRELRGAGQVEQVSTSWASD
jgi:hypothetical protein